MFPDYVLLFYTFIVCLGEFMNQDIKESLATILNDVMNNHESNFELVQDIYGIDSIEANNHIYNLARNLWTEFEIDLMTV